MTLFRFTQFVAIAALATIWVACATPAPNDDEEDGRSGTADARAERDIGGNETNDVGATRDVGFVTDTGGSDAVADDASAPDADAPDAGTPDAGTPDTGTPDAGTPDVGTPDAGTPDAGTPDAGTPDAGTPDTGTPDTGTPDAGVPEICNNRMDDDRDGRVDCDDTDCSADPACVPVAFEICTNRIDDDGDGRVDCDDADCAGDPSCVTTAFEVCNNRIDDDGDGRVDCDDADCSADPACIPAGFEICTNGIDDDGDGRVDCDDADCSAEPTCSTTGGDACADALVATLGTNTGAVRGEASTLSSAFCGGSGPEQVWTFVAPESRTYCAQTAGSSFDTVLYVRTVCDQPASEETCNDDASGLQSEVEFRALAGETLSVIVDAFNPGTNGTISLTITNEPCSIVVADPEICDDSIDNDRDFFTDCRDSDCDDDPACQEICDDGSDNDGDFATDCSDSDCADDPACRPGGTVCEDALTAEVGTQLGDVGTGRSRMSGTCGGSGGPEQAWSFTARRAGAYCVDTFGSGFDTVLYARNTCETSSSQIACDDDTDGPQSQLELTLAIGQRITLFVDAYSSSPTITGYGLNIFEGTCNEAYPEICDDGTDNDGDFDTDCYDDDCADAPNCQEICDDDIDNDRDFRWDCNDPDCEGDPACTELVCDDGVDNDDDFWTDCADDDCDDDPACQPFTCASPLTFSGFGTLSGDASNGESALSGSCGGNGREAVIAWTPTTSGPVCVDTVGSSYDTVLYARETCTSTGSQLACSDDAPGISPRSAITLEASAGTTIYVVVDAFSFGAGSTFDVNFAAGDCGP